MTLGTEQWDALPHPHHLITFVDSILQFFISLIGKTCFDPCLFTTYLHNH
ncbi:hypothetical protein XIS1_1250026 [Xenorhabdus innexi]|uniref:Uncharacterized protein n=1 Tax=Xenorhabdus innexi TaxID=290109 RepID=A0A1N6MSA6_9GAMM|nr:hypothetical protein XIS1_1250026 [Xenorhabdus innexi]